jgi:hypothetical protein
LVVLRRTQAKHDLNAPLEELIRKEVAALHVRAVRGKCVDLAGEIDTSDESVAIPAARVTTDHHNIAMARSPLALHPQEAISDVEEHVVSPTLSSRPINVDAQLERFKHDRGLSDVPLLIRREHATDRSRSIGWAVS